MRKILACAAFTVFLAGCGDYRDSMMVVPDRQGHAASDPNNIAPNTVNKVGPAAGPGEMYITLGAQDSLSTVAKAYGVTLKWLIERNRLTQGVNAGDNLIVPAPR